MALTTGRFVVHTYGSTLELPSTYQHCNDLAEESMALINDKESKAYNIT